MHFRTTCWKLAYVLVFVCLIVPLTPLSATIWNIKPDGSGDAPTIQAGIALAVDTDTVLVASGVYTGDGNRDIDFLGKAILVIAECRYDTTATDSTVIDCQGEAGSDHRGFYFHSGESDSSILEGFTITNGNLQYLSSPIGASGGGILCDSLSSPTIKYNTIRNCRTFYKGGGIACLRSSSPKIYGNDIYNNTSNYSCGAWGVGIFCTDGHKLVIEKNRIHDNEGQGCDSGGDGGVGMAIYADSILIIDNYIARNHGYQCYGVGIDASGSFVQIHGNEIAHNRASRSIGAGIYIENSTVIISDNLIHNNTSGSYGSGAGISISSSAATIRNNDILYNYCDEMGGGIYVNSSERVSIQNNRIDSNSGEEGSGGIWLSAHPESDITNNEIKDNIGVGIYCNSSILISDNLISGNLSYPYSSPAGGIDCGSSSPTIVGNTITDNTGQWGGGIFCGALSSSQIRQNIIAYNSVFDLEDFEDFGGGIYSKSEDIEISCCDVFGNEGNNYAGIPDQTGINGNISIDPIFCDPDNGDYSIHINSPCAPSNHPTGDDCSLIGALDPTCDYVATLLLASSVSQNQSTVTLAWSLSDETDTPSFTIERAQNPTWQYTTIPAPLIAGDGTSFSFTDDLLVPGESYRYRVAVLDESGEQFLFETETVNVPLLPLALHQNYPNPFNPSTTIMYYLPTSGRINLNVYDVSGRLIVRLADDIQDQGHHSVAWNGFDERGNTMSSGTYFYKLTAGKETISRKMVLLR